MYDCFCGLFPFFNRGRRRVTTTKVEAFKPIEHVLLETQILQDPASRNDLFHLLGSSGMDFEEITDVINKKS